MKILLVISITSLVVASCMSVYAYVEFEKIKEIQTVDFECTKEWSKHWEEFTVWEIKNGDTTTPQQWDKKWKQYALDGLALDARCNDRMESLFNDDYYR